MLSPSLVVGAAVLLGQAHEVSVPEEAIEHFKYLVGKWTADGETGRLEFKGACHADWAPGTHCLVLHAVWTSFDGRREHATAVCGWDDLKKQIVETWVLFQQPSFRTPLQHQGAFGSGGDADRPCALRRRHHRVD